MRRTALSALTIITLSAALFSLFTPITTSVNKTPSSTSSDSWIEPTGPDLLALPQAPQPTPKSLKECLTEDTDAQAKADERLCITFYIRTTAAKRDAKTVLSEITETLRDDLPSNPRCHTAMHALGVAIAPKVEDPVSLFFEYTDRCASGLQHGALPALVIDKSLPDAVIFFKELCADPRFIDPNLSFNNCWHAAGHAFITRARLDLPTIIRLCMESPENDTHRRECSIGAFMDLLSYHLPVGVSDTLEVCRNTLLRDYPVIAQGCAVLAPQGISDKSPSNIKKELKRCQEFPAEVSGWCHTGFAFMAGQLGLGEDFRDRICDQSLLRKEDVTECQSAYLRVSNNQ